VIDKANLGRSKPNSKSHTGTGRRTTIYQFSKESLETETVVASADTDQELEFQSRRSDLTGTSYDPEYSPALIATVSAYW